jgi:hypothetical protein
MIEPLTRRRAWAALPRAVIGFCAFACAAPSKPVPVPVPPESYEPRQELEIWRGSEAITLHGVRVAADNLSGVPLWRPPDCDSCRIAVPLATVDSVRMVRTERSWMFLASLPFAMLGAVVLTWRLFGGND